MDTNNNKLTPEFKAKWIAALRSGEYIQTGSRLKFEYKRLNGSTEVRHCCLGVAADIVDPEAWFPHGRWNGNAWSLTNVLPASKTQEEFADILFLARDNPAVVTAMLDAVVELFPDHAQKAAHCRTEKNPQGVLARLNDDFGFTFEQIATVIEKVL